MATHNIKVGVKNNSQTTTVFPVSKNDHVNFHNLGNATLTVTFDAPADPSAPRSPLCDGNVDAPNPITVVALANKSFKVCKGEIGNQFSYTAQIEGFAAEDPIVIIEKARAFNLDFASAAAGAGVAIAVYLVVKALSRTRVTRPKP